ncbi:MAG: hypothetical protein F6J90_00035 [Moorea sp. SIOASIH]|uniref:hypothetical protein n=1 Tax=Moorena sp. SIOASIH TaxID=2607817 RepID=UPI0013B7572C|nr:hypothetical protein [Moorena sp. SIOASIH]NEO34778.1 hypothetical protein [Moorena sp. SIOASIH]
MSNSLMRSAIIFAVSHPSWPKPFFDFPGRNRYWLLLEKGAIGGLKVTNLAHHKREELVSLEDEFPCVCNGVQILLPRVAGYSLLNFLHRSIWLVNVDLD